MMTQATLTYGGYHFIYVNAVVFSSKDIYLIQFKG
jgi:hypothetical protein